MRNFLLNPEPSNAIYFLKKIHKNVHAVQPIVSEWSGPTENASVHGLLPPSLLSREHHLTSGNLATSSTYWSKEPYQKNTPLVLLISQDYTSTHPM